MKGMLFGGCSYTWGQGLYFYSDLPDLYNPKNIHEFLGHKVTNAQIEFKNTIRYARLVSNHFNTFEIVKIDNGGSDDETFNFFRYIFRNTKEVTFDEKYTKFKKYYDYVTMYLTMELLETNGTRLINTYLRINISHIV